MIIMREQIFTLQIIFILNRRLTRKEIVITLYMPIGSLFIYRGIRYPGIPLFIYSLYLPLLKLHGQCLE